MALALSLSLCLRPAPAAAQVMGEPADPLPNPDKFSRGLFAEAEAGTLVFLGEARAPLGAGMALGARVGYELWRFLAVQLHGLASTHQTDFSAGPQGRQLLQLYQGTAELRLAVPLGQWAVFGFGGGGFGRLSSNLLGTTGLTAPNRRNTPVLGGGLGFDYHTRSRHFSFGLAAAYWRHSTIEAPGAASATAYLRYTF